MLFDDRSFHCHPSTTIEIKAGSTSSLIQSSVLIVDSTLGLGGVMAVEEEV